MCDMPHRSIRFPDDLDAEIVRQARLTDRSFSNAVIRLCRIGLAPNAEIKRLEREVEDYKRELRYATTGESDPLS